MYLKSTTIQKNATYPPQEDAAIQHYNFKIIKRAVLLSFSLQHPAIVNTHLSF
jgi:hypothetical protein